MAVSSTPSTPRSVSLSSAESPRPSTAASPSSGSALWEDQEQERDGDRDDSSFQAPRQSFGHFPFPHHHSLPPILFFVASPLQQSFILHIRLRRGCSLDLSTRLNRCIFVCPYGDKDAASPKLFLLLKVCLFFFLLLLLLLLFFFFVVVVVFD